MFFVPLKQKKLGLFIRFFEIFSLIFLPGSGSETSNSGSRNKFGIHNSATGTVSIVKKMLKRSHKK